MSASPMRVTSLKVGITTETDGRWGAPGSGETVIAPQRHEVAFEVLAQREHLCLEAVAQLQHQARIGRLRLAEEDAVSNCHRRLAAQLPRRERPGRALHRPRERAIAGGDGVY